MGESALKVWVDFLCPWARIGAFWLHNVVETGAVGQGIVWKSFLLEDINLPEEASADELWANPAERRGLLPAAAAKYVQAQAPDRFKDFQRAMFDARHVEHEKIGRPEVTAQVLSRVGLDGESIGRQLSEDRRWLEAARADHEEAKDLGIFGVPTFVFPDAAPAFIRLMEVTEGERARVIYDRIVSAVADPAIHEIKRPSIRR